MKPLSASSLHRAFRCQYWLRDDVEWAPETRSRVANLGIVAHAAFQRIAEGHLVRLDPLATEYGLDEREADTLREYVDAWAAWASQQDRDGWMMETKFAYDVATDSARMLTAKDHRDYSERRPGEIAGTEDLGWNRDGLAYTLDYKSGAGWHVAGPSENEQIKFLLLARVRAFGLRKGVGSILHVRDTSTFLRDAPMDALDLAAFAGQLYELLAKDIARAVPEVGPHCRYCPAKPSCPAFEAAVEGAVSEDILVPRLRLYGPIGSRTEAAYRLKMVPVLKEAVEAIDTLVKEYADAYGGIETDDGVYKRVTKKVRRLDVVEGAADVIRSLLGESAVPIAIEQSISAASIKRAAKAVKASHVDQQVKDIIAVLATLPGAVKETERPGYEVIKDVE